MTKLGITGTRSRHLITARQEGLLMGIIDNPHVELVHHGDCTGADELAHEIALANGKQIVIHPPIDETYRAFCSGPEDQVLILPPKPYLVRNGDIVAAVGKLVAVPAVAYEVRRSGTWATVRNAARRGMSEANGRVVILRP